METVEISNKELLSDVLIDLHDENNLKVAEKQEAKLVCKDEVLAIVLLYKNSNFKDLIKPYNLEICGKKMFEWVTSAVDCFETKTITCDDSSNIVSLVKPLLNDKKIVVVLYSDTPLISYNTIEDIVDYFNFRGLNVLKLNRGWVFNSEYIKSAESVSSVITHEFGELDFYPVGDYKALNFVTEKIEDKILNFHLENGVIIEDRKSTFIDADVIIGKGVKIRPNNVLRGETFVANNCVLESGNTIENSIIGANCVIKNSYIKNSKITDNMVVGPFEIIEGKES